MIAAVVLAAGRASRFGSSKLLAPLHGAPVVRRTVERALASRVGAVLVVTGADGAAVADALAGLPVRLVPNARWESGMGTSLAAGIAALPAEAAAAVILLGDQPTVDPATIEAVIAAHARSGRPIVAPRYRGEHGHPVLFARSVFPELRALAGDRGARAVVERDPARVEVVPVDRAAPADVDTPADLARVARGER